MNTAGDSGWLLFTDEHRVNAINVYLPNARVKVLSGKLSLKELSQQLNNADFTAESEPEPTLTRRELQVCSLISKGISFGAHRANAAQIAQNYLYPQAKRDDQIPLPESGGISPKN